VSKLQSVKVNGVHIGNVSKVSHTSTWKAWSAFARVSINGPAQCFTGRTRTECADWLKAVYETHQEHR